MRGSNGALAAALSALLPTGEQTRLLRACLAGGDGTGVRREAVGRLAPLLQASGACVDAKLATFLKTSYLYEQLRAREYLPICALAFIALEEAGLPFLVLKGAALGGGVYGDQALRHSHDLDLLVREGDRAAAADALAGAGFAPRDGEFVHPCGLPVRLQTRLFRLSFYRSGWDELRARSGTGTVGDRTVRLLSPADNLLHACGHASYSQQRSSLQWVCDAWLIIRRQRVDWNAFSEAAVRSRLALPLSVMLGYLARDLGAAVPPSVLGSLGRFATPCERDVALSGARHGAARSLLSAANGWRQKLTILKWLLVPSPGYLRRAYGVRYAPLLPVYYLARPVSYLLRHRRRHA